MIDDIVLLPRRLKQFKRDADVSSEVLYCSPMSCIPRIYGYETPNDDTFAPYGTTISLPTGHDTWFRFKMIENTPNAILEFYCISESPVDVLHIKKSKKTCVYCLWVAATDPKTYQQKKYVLWEHVRAFMRYETEDNVSDVPIEAAIASELWAFAEVYGMPDVLHPILDYPDKKDIVRISELNPKTNWLDAYLNLGANIRALSDIYAFDDTIHAPNPGDVFRGVDIPEKWIDANPLKRSSVLKHLIWGPICISELMFLFSPRFALHCFQRGFNMTPLPGDTEISIPKSDDHNVFSIIEYIERIPYGEFELRISVDGKCDFVHYNPFDMNILSREVSADHTNGGDCEEVMKASAKIRELMDKDVVQVIIARSWAEEAYITFRYADGNVQRFYVDVSVHALCSRSLLRDYEVPSFITK